MELTVCTTCSRHIRSTEGRCPFCDAPSTSRSPARAVVMAAVVVATGLTLAACYGGPPHPMPGPRTGDNTTPAPQNPPPSAQPGTPAQPAAPAAPPNGQIAQ